MTQKSTEMDSTAGNVPTILCTFTNCRKLFLFPKYHPDASMSISQKDEVGTATECDPVIKGKSCQFEKALSSKL